MKTFAMGIVAALLIAAPTFAVEFTGPRVGVTAGYQSIKGTTSADGIAYGANVGYDFAITPNWTVGAQVDYNGSSANKTINLVNINADADWGAGARVGYKLNEGVLVYAGGGYERGKFNSVSLDGYRLNTGVEFALTDHIFGTVEYRYNDYTKTPHGGDVKSNNLLLGATYRF